MNHRPFPPTELGSSWTDADDVRCDIYSGRCVLLLGISIAAGLTACQLIDYPQVDRLLPTLALAGTYLAAGWGVLSGRLDRVVPWSGPAAPQGVRPSVRPSEPEALEQLLARCRASAPRLSPRRAAQAAAATAHLVRKRAAQAAATSPNAISE